MNCYYCEVPSRCHCDLCDRPFCEDHGTRSTIVCGIETSACANCGGFNADEGMEANELRTA